MKPEPDIATARQAAAIYIRERGYDDEAQKILRGQGDDYAEVRIALALLRIMAPISKAPATKKSGRRLLGEEC